MAITTPPATNLLLWLEADVGVYKDTAGTTPAAADGDLVALWQDQSGAGNHVLQATSGNRPSWRTNVINGKPIVRLNQAGATKMATAGSVAHGIGTGDFWFTAVWLIPAVNNSNTSLTLLSIGAFAPAFYMPDHGGTGGIYKNNIWLGGGFLFGQNVHEATWYLTEITRISGTWKQYQSSGGVAPTLDPTSFTAANSIGNAAFNVGWDTSGTDYGNQDVAELLLYKGSLNSTDQASLESYLLAKYWPPPAYRPVAPAFPDPTRFILPGPVAR